MKLFKHQQDGVNLAMAHGGNAALFWDPGCGKTLGALTAYAQLQAKTPGLKLLVVCPLSLIHAAWGADIRKFTQFTYAPWRSIVGQPPDIVIINYESLISKKILPELRRFIAKHPTMCVLDESSRMKSHKSMTTKVLLSLAPFFRHRIILSGTPMPNSEMELWAQMRFVNPTIFDKSFYAFRNTHFHLERAGEIMAPQGRVMSRQMMREIMMKGWRYSITPFMREHLMRKVRPWSHWVKKADALDLPEQVDQVREIALSRPEQEAYRDLRNYLVTEIGGEMVAAPVALAKLMKLRQVTSGFVYNAEGKALPVGTSKLDELADTIEQCGDQQVLIFIEFKHEIEMIRDMLTKKYGLNEVVTLYSETDNREESIERFQQGKARYLIAHPKSAAHGLTFVNCSTIVFYSLDYSFENYEQARNRIHRIGQGNSCTYIHLVAKGTIDETILAVLQKKQSLQDAVNTIVKGAQIERNIDKAGGPADDKERVPAGVRLQGSRQVHVGHTGSAA